MPDRAPLLVLSCEHGGNRIPARWAPLFRDAGALLNSHRGWDPGALDLARALSRRLGVPLVATTVSRLLVETNRSAGHPRLFSELTRALPPEERRDLLRRYWGSHRRKVEEVARAALGRGGRVLHVGVHSFTPVLDGVTRDVDVGVLYDSARRHERELCREWIRALRVELPELRVRANAPYRGASDGLTTHLRRQLGERYLGVELEVGQALLGSDARTRRRVLDAVARTLALSTRAPRERQRLDAREASGARSTPRASARRRTRPSSGL